jgi:hypothetical protein
VTKVTNEMANRSKLYFHVPFAYIHTFNSSLELQVICPFCHPEEKSQINKGFQQVTNRGDK